MSPKNMVVLGAGALVLISMSQKSGSMVQGIQTSNTIESARTELNNQGKQQKNLKKAESDLAVDRYKGGCILSTQGFGGIPSQQAFFKMDSDVSLFNPGDIICNQFGATAVVVSGPNGNVLDSPATVNHSDMDKVRDIIKEMEAQFTVQ
jgi:hypothetical protein